MDVDLGEIGLAKLLTRGADDVQPVAAGCERGADCLVEDRAPPCSQGRIPEAHDMLGRSPLEARELRTLQREPFAFFTLHLRAPVGAGGHALHGGRV